MTVKEQSFFNDIDSSEYKKEVKEWFVSDNIDVGKAFQDFQIHMAEEANSREIHIESDTHAILALSNILLIKNSQSNEIFNHYFPDSTLRIIKEKVEEKYGIISFNPDTRKKSIVHFDMAKKTKSALEEVVKSVIRDEITMKQAAKQIVNLTSDEPEAQPDNMLLLGIRNLIESIPKSKTNEPIRESNLSCTYVNSVLNPLFTAPDKDRLLIW